MERVARSPDGLSIGYEVRGSGMPALVFVHGWCCDRTYWRHQLEHFAGTHQVIAPDLGGHGTSGAGRSSWTIPAFAADVVSVVARSDVARTVLVGHSMGGDVAVDAAVLLADLVAGVVLVDTYGTLDAPRSEEAIDTFLAPFRTDFAASMRGFVATMSAPVSDPDVRDRVSADMAAAPPDIALDAARHSFLNARKLPDLLRRIAAPVIAINSDWLKTDPAGLTRYGIDRVETMSGGHFVMLEDAPRFNAVLDAVLARHCAG
jgi:pimeloyl-ACP methyl ester carboxylesterase